MSINSYAQTCDTTNKNCYLASDLGQGGIYVIDSHADSILESNKFLSTNLQSNPPYKQVVKWVDTGLITTGMVFETNAISTLKIYVDGEWSPWGTCTNSISDCRMCCCGAPCQTPAGTTIGACPASGLTSNGICMVGGQGINPNPGLLDVPCKLSKGYGLYGLIVDQGSNLDPNNVDGNNNPVYINNFPPDGFRTFHAIADQTDKDGNYLELTSTKFCYLDNNTPPTSFCRQDSQLGQNRTLMSGKLYLKILDTYYDDNYGSYTVNIVSGVYLPSGFIETFYNDLKDILEDVQQATNTQLITNLASIGRSLLTFYIALTGVLFLMGVTNITHTDILVRLFKVFIILTLISDTSFSFFNTNLMPYFTVLPQQVADIIMNTTLYYPGSGTSRWLMSEGGGALSIFDTVVRLLLSKVVHIKIVSLIFTQYAYYILGIYIGIFFILSMILRSMMLWFLANLKMVILLAVAPLFIIMILFSRTKEYFNNWLKQMTSAALTLVISTAVLALMMGMFTGQLQALLNYKICWDVFFNIPSPFNMNFYFWVPDASDTAKALNGWNLISFILFGMLFNSFSTLLAQLCDVLSRASIQGISTTYSAGMSGFQGTVGKSYYLARGATAEVISRGAKAIYSQIKRTAGERVERGAARGRGANQPARGRGANGRAEGRGAAGAGNGPAPGAAGGAAPGGDGGAPGGGGGAA